MKMSKLTFFDKLMLLAAIILTVGLIFGILAGKNDPRAHVILAFFGLAYPFFLLGNLILIAYWILRKKWLFAIVTVMVICLGWQTLTATFSLFGDSGSTEKSEKDFVSSRKVLIFAVRIDKKLRFCGDAGGSEYSG